jgi:elongation factor Ts
MSDEDWLTEGTIESYNHHGRVGVLVEVACETHFVSLTERFVTFAKDLAMHIAASRGTLAISDEQVPRNELEREKRIYAEQAAARPENIREKVVEGKINAWLDDVVLLRQKHVNIEKYEGKSIEELRAELAAYTGEPVVIRRFARFEIGS